MENLRDPETRREIHDDMWADTDEWENLVMQSTPEGTGEGR